MTTEDLDLKKAPKVLAYLKTFWAATYPVWETYQAISNDGIITKPEQGEIIQALVIWVGVWAIPNIGYIRTRLKGKTQTVEPADEPGKHEWIDTDHDGVSDKVELEANDPGRVAARPLPRKRPTRREGDEI